MSANRKRSCNNNRRHERFLAFRHCQTLLTPRPPNELGHPKMKIKKLYENVRMNPRTFTSPDGTNTNAPHQLMDEFASHLFRRFFVCFRWVAADLERPIEKVMASLASEFFASLAFSYRFESLILIAESRLNRKRESLVCTLNHLTAGAQRGPKSRAQQLHCLIFICS